MPVTEPKPAVPDVPWPTRAFVRLAVLLGAVGFLVGVAIWLFAPRKYESVSEIIRVGESDFALPGALGAIGGEFGLGGERASDSPNFVISLIKSTDVLTAAVLDTHRLNMDDPNPRTLAEILTKRPPDTPKNVARARKKLRKNITAGVNIRTDIIRIGIEMPTPELAQAVQLALIAHTDSANRRIQRTQARHRREFIGDRLELANERLEHAENTLSAFENRNIQFQQSPELTAEHRRLQRRVSASQELSSSLARDYEEALQEEASSIPSLTIVTEPSLPWIKSWPSGRKVSMAGTAAGVALAVLLTFVALRGRDDESAPLHSSRDILGDVSRRIRALYRTIA